MRSERLGFLGAGQMAEAILRGVLQARLFDPGAITASDPAEPRRALFAALGVNATESNRTVAQKADVLIAAVKPQNVADLLAEIAGDLQDRHVLISICAGVPIARFEAAAPGGARVVRAMPNQPMRVRMGATALCPRARARPGDMALAREIFGAAGTTVVVAEELMDAVTAVSGSGPAYFYFMVEALNEAGQREGLPADVARTLAIQTARGAAAMMVQEGDVSPEELRRRVTSKGGTTEAAFRMIEELGVREGFIRAVQAAARRSRELRG